VRFIRTRQVLEMIGVSRTTLWRMVRAGTFPQPVHVTTRSRAFLLEAVETWMNARTDRAQEIREWRRRDPSGTRRAVLLTRCSRGRLEARPGKVRLQGPTSLRNS
jgi:prophage regulatory protein